MSVLFEIIICCFIATVNLRQVKYRNCRVKRIIGIIEIELKFIKSTKLRVFKINRTVNLKPPTLFYEAAW